MPSNSEKVDMILVYGECQTNSRISARLYAGQYLDRYHPPHNYFIRVELSLRIHKTGIIGEIKESLMER